MKLNGKAIKVGIDIGIRKFIGVCNAKLMGSWSIDMNIPYRRRAQPRGNAIAYLMYHLLKWSNKAMYKTAVATKMGRVAKITIVMSNDNRSRAMRSCTICTKMRKTP